MKVKQQTLQSFEFILSDTDDEKFFSYMRQNEPLLKGHLLMFSAETISKNILNFLKEKNICFIHRVCELTTKKKSVITLPNISIDEALQTIKKSEEFENNIVVNRKDEKLREVINKPVRSGTVIKTDNDLIILSQINSGSEIEVSGNMELFGTVNGKVVCDGQYMLIRNIGEYGQVIFKGIILNKDKFKTKKAKLLKLDRDNKLLIDEL